MTKELYTVAAQLLKALIAIPSFSREEQSTAGLLYNFLQKKGVAAHRLINNVWATNKHYDAAKPTLLLNSHHDTVKPNAAYTREPFKPDLEDGKLYGLGSNDAGGCLVSLLAAFLHFYNRTDLQYNLVFAATAEEEISGPNGLEMLIPSLGNITAAIVGEPTEMQMAVAEKGLLVLDCTARGVAGHAARHIGENAIYKAMKSIEWFSTYHFPEESAMLGPVVMTVTTISAGTQHNVVPAACNFTVDIRLNEHYDHQQVIELVRKHVDCDVAPRSTRLKPSSINMDHDLVKAGTAIGLKAFGSYTLSDMALMPFPALKIGPGNTLRSHMADEFIYLHELEQGVDIYIKLLNQLL
ncbi:MAG: M20 family metallo-hydrolase [Taibaiella sp.]|nr:M20 family metallo-hydrolase [Taibaiella sp.]